MSLMTPDYWVVAIVFYTIGLFLCALFRLAERNTYYIKGEKKYKKEGRITYFFIYTILILFVLLMKPSYGLLPYLDIFNGLSAYEQDGFLSLGGLYDAQEMEPLFMLWVSAVRSITQSQTLFLFLSFSYIWICVLYFSSSFYNRSSFTITFMAMWPVLIDFIFGMRYAMAVATCLLAMVFFKKKRYIIGFTLSIAACFIHYLAFVFIMYLGFFFALTLLFKEKINSIKVILIMVAGSAVFTVLGYSVFSSFRFAYRMTDTVESNSILSYAPMVLFAFVILYYSRKNKMSLGNNLCTSSSYFNMVMLPVTALWGVYRIPYLFLLPITVELNNLLTQNKKSWLINVITVIVVLIFSFVKIITMGVQNFSLEYEFNF